VGAAKVILPMPKRSLELIDFSAFVPRARFHRALDCICQRARRITGLAWVAAMSRTRVLMAGYWDKLRGRSCPPSAFSKRVFI
jgi:hypothetical protein